MLALVSCGAHPHHVARDNVAGDEVTLYRDFALVRQRIEVDVPATTATVKIVAAIGVSGEQIVVVDRDGLAINGVHVFGDTEPHVDVPTPDGCKSVEGCSVDVDEERRAQLAERDGEPLSERHADVPPVPAAPSSTKPTEVRLDVTAPHPGHYAIAIAYVTDRLAWDAAYTMTTTPARELAVLRGAVAIRNTTGIVLHHVALQVVDAEIGVWRNRTAEHLATALVGGSPSTTPAAIPRELGTATLGVGETRVAVTEQNETARRMHSVLVYDPIGTKLDNASPTPTRDIALGVSPASVPHVTESFEVARDEDATRGLPAGPVRLLERRPDGALAVLGESRLFDAATRVADVDTIAVGTADGVIGHRERREYTIDDENHRITEELVITIDNQRDHEVGVLVREHLYRGLNWALAFESTRRATKEGAQQIALRTNVPAKTTTKIMYVVVYTWGQ